MQLLVWVQSIAQILFTIYKAGKINTAVKSTFDTFMVINVMFAMFLWGNVDLNCFQQEQTKAKQISKLF